MAAYRRVHDSRYLQARPGASGPAPHRKTAPLERGADCLHVVLLMLLHPKTPSSLASFKSRLVLPFRFRLTQVVLEKRPLNGCSSSSVFS